MSDITEQIEKLAEDYADNHKWSKEGFIAGYKAALQNKVSDINPEEDLIYRIVENWGNAVHPVSEMVGWLKEYASIVNERKDSADWISVEDRLPDDDETVLIFDGNNVYVGGYGYVLSRRKKDKKKWYMHNQDWDGMSAESKVTHWMPLPAPPGSQPQQKEDEESEKELEERTEMNMNVISDFCEYVKNEVGLVIPESTILSFFNA